nr:immunoglobulin heavy chain junction region [Macaca mulatta]
CARKWIGYGLDSW